MTRTERGRRDDRAELRPHVPTPSRRTAALLQRLGALEIGMLVVGAVLVSL